MRNTPRTTGCKLSTCRIGVVLALLHLMPLAAGWLHGWKWAAAGLFLTGAVMAGSTFNPRGGLFGRARRGFATDGREVCLTIDDGPCDDTAEVLGVLEEYDCKAMFFLIGERAAERPREARHIVEAGHRIGNHTQTHPVYWFWGYPPSMLRREIRECQMALVACTGVRPGVFRAPAGFLNPFGMAVAAEAGLELVGWQARGWDGVACDVDDVVRRIRRSLRPGAIILVHQGLPHSVQVLRAVLAMLRDDGWKITLPAD